VVDRELRVGTLLGVKVGQQSPENLVVRLEPMSVITGQVIDGERKPAAEVLVFLYQNGGPWSGELDATRTDEAGRYQFRAVPGINISVRAGGDDDSDMSETILTKSGQRHVISDRVYIPWQTRRAGRRR